MIRLVESIIYSALLFRYNRLDSRGKCTKYENQLLMSIVYTYVPAILRLPKYSSTRATDRAMAFPLQPIKNAALMKAM